MKLSKKFFLPVSILLLLLLSNSVHAQRSSPKSVTIPFQSGNATNNGFTSASATLTYAIISCPDGVASILYRYERSTYKTSTGYYYDGKLYDIRDVVPDTPSSIPVSGNIVNERGVIIGTFSDHIAGTAELAGCYGQSKVFAKISTYFPDRESRTNENITKWMNTLRLVPNTSPPRTDSKVGNHIRGILWREKQEKERQERERVRQEEEKKRQEEELERQRQEQIEKERIEKENADAEAKATAEKQQQERIENERRQREAKQEQERKEREARAEEERQRQQRVRDYQERKRQQEEKNRELAAASAAASATAFVAIATVLYQGMGQVDPDNLYLPPLNSKDRFIPKLHTWMNFGFTTMASPLIFQSDRRFVNFSGNYVEEKALETRHTFTVNLDLRVGLGIENDYYTLFGMGNAIGGISPIFTDNMYAFHGGGGLSLGLPWVKFFFEQLQGPRSFYSFSLLDVDEYGDGARRESLTRVNYGLKLTIPGNQRNHIYLGFLEERSKLEGRMRFNRDGFLASGNTHVVEGFSIRWFKDHYFNFYVNFFPDYTTVGNVTMVPNGDLGSNHLFIEIGFLRSINWFKN